ncbi:LysR family transcriptional regulator [Amycolatopsis sp. NPDC005232]|uniref:LysR family transcriptional regulator n=1 Tax=Amycolatopsis sp. NPDC005232 TaxID=3157027 RepID=UPI0033AF23AA
MELRHLRHFVALAEEGTFTAAAARELIVQSGLSTSVRALEKDVGAPLFVRGTRPVRLTAEGEALLPAARRALDAVEAVQQTVRDVHGVLSGRLRIGVIETSGHTLPFGAWLAQFSREHPAISITVRQLPAVRALELVGQGELDCALVSAVPGLTAGLQVVQLLSEPMMLACSPGHRLAGATSVELEDLEGERFVDMDPGWAVRVLVDDAFRAAGVTRKMVYEVNEWAIALGLLAAGMGVALVPSGLDFSLHPDTAGSLRLVPLRGAPLTRHVDLVLPKGHGAAPAAVRFAQHVSASRRLNLTRREATRS